MKIKDKYLIKNLGTNKINENNIQTIDHFLTLNFNVNPNINIYELLEIIKIFNVPNNINIISNNPEKIKEIIKILPSNVKISLLNVNKNIIENLESLDTLRVSGLDFDNDDIYTETINISEIRKKFPNLLSINYTQLLDYHNVDNITDIHWLLSISGKVNISEELLHKYKTSWIDFLGSIPSYIEFGDKAIYNKNIYEKMNKLDDEILIYPSCELNCVEDFSKYAEESKEKDIYFEVSSMADISLEVAKKLQTVRSNIYILMNSYDNSSYQNTFYTIDEYVEMCEVMETLIGDIDENIPEKKRFAKIYERVTKYLVYDYPAAYPQNKEEKEYSKKNKIDCRNLINGLLYGKTVCAGYADILKNACRLKGLECEYIQGPVDSLIKKEAYFMRNKEERGQIIFSDDEYFITREYHAWNKIKLDGKWYNCDPTWDRNEIIKGIQPKYFLWSDDAFKKIGRPTSRVFRHSCNTEISADDMDLMFPDYIPDYTDGYDLYYPLEISDFENTVDEYGNPSQLPVVPKVYPWTKTIIQLKEFLRFQRKSIIGKIQEKFKKNGNNEGSITDHLLSIEKSLTTVEENYNANQILNAKKNKIPSWELSKEELEVVNRKKTSKVQKKSQIREDGRYD